jgi:hypothetical protein
MALEWYKEGHDKGECNGPEYDRLDPTAVLCPWCRAEKAEARLKVWRDWYDAHVDEPEFPYDPEG